MYREQITLDKYEYKVRSDEIKNLIAVGEYVQAAEIADVIDWKRVKSVNMLCTIGDLYKINRRYEDAKNILLLAYERRPGGRTICYSLCELCIKTEEFVQAVNYYKEFVQAAPKDSGRYILQYKLYEAQDVGLEERIGVLEELKKRDYREKWAYELAYLYHRVGLATRCVEECDELILWFGEGKYVVKAMELKMLHEPLSPSQQEKYDHRFDEPEEAAKETEDQSEEPWEQQQSQEEAGWDAYDRPYGEENWDAYDKSQGEDVGGTYSREAISDEEAWEADGQLREEGWDVYAQSQEAGRWDFHGQAEEAEEWGHGEENAYGQMSGAAQWNAPDDGQEDDVWDGSGPHGEDDSRQYEADRGQAGEDLPREEQDDLDIQVKTMDVSQYNTINLQQELAAGLQEVLGEEERKDSFLAVQAEEPKGKGTHGAAAGKIIQVVTDDTGAMTGGVSLDREYFASGWLEEEQDYVRDDTAELVLAQMRLENERKLLRYPGSREDNPQDRKRSVPIAEEEVQEALEENGPRISEMLEESDFQAGEALEKGAAQAGEMLEDGGFQAGEVLEESDFQAGEVLEKGAAQAAEMLEDSGFQAGEALEKGAAQAAEMLEDSGFQAGEVLEKGAAQAGEMLEGNISQVQETLEENVLPFSDTWGECDIPVPEVREEDNTTSVPETRKAESAPSVSETGKDERESLASETPKRELDAQRGVEAQSENAVIEKQITGQINIEDILAEWERTKKDSEERYKEEIRQDVLRQTGPMFTEFEEAVRDGLLERLEKGEEVNLDEIQVSQEQGEAVRKRDTGSPEELIDTMESDLLMEEPESITEAEEETGEALLPEADSVERDVAKVRSLTREEKELYAPFIQSRSARERLVQAIDNISMAAYTGNIVVTGEEGMDTMTFAKNVIREVQMTDRNFSGKVAKISGQGLNGRDVNETLWQLNNGALIIHRASGMEPRTAAALHRALQQENLGIIVLMEDTKKAMQRMFLGTPELYGDFTARMDLEALSNDTLVAFGRRYAREMEYSIDNLGILALHTRIEELQTIDHVVTVVEVKKIVDEAIRHACRKTLGHFFDILFSRRYDEEDMIILTEKDFVY